MGNGYKCHHYLCTHAYVSILCIASLPITIVLLFHSLSLILSIIGVFIVIGVFIRLTVQLSLVLVVVSLSLSLSLISSFHDTMHSASPAPGNESIGVEEPSPFSRKFVAFSLDLLFVLFTAI